MVVLVRRSRIFTNTLRRKSSWFYAGGHTTNPTYDQVWSKQAAEHTIQTLKDDDLDIVTELSPAPTFYPAEDYHQNYYEKNPSQGYCNFAIPPKLLKLHSKFQHLMKN